MIHDITKWNYFEKHVYEYIFKKTWKRIYELELIEETIPYYLYLLNGKYEIDILTKTGFSLSGMTKRLSQLNIRKGLEYNNIIKTTEKKIDFEYDVFIDDNPQMVEDMLTQEKKYLLLYDSPWNKSIDCSLYRNVFRVCNWNEILEKIEMIEKIWK